MSAPRRMRVPGVLAVLAAANLGLIAVLAGVQVSFIPEWTTQQWVFAVVLPVTGLAVQVIGGLALWWWLRRRRAAGPVRARLGGRHRRLST
jgi:hypothetical protein